MKKIIVALAFALIAPLAFAQTGSKAKGQEATTAETVTVTGTIVKMTTEEGAAASYQPTKTLVVREDSSMLRALMFSGAWSRCGQGGQSHPNRDQTRRSCACLLHKRRRFAYG